VNYVDHSIVTKIIAFDLRYNNLRNMSERLVLAIEHSDYSYTFKNVNLITRYSIFFITLFVQLIIYLFKTSRELLQHF